MNGATPVFDSDSETEALRQDATLIFVHKLPIFNRRTPSLKTFDSIVRLFCRDTWARFWIWDAQGQKLYGRAKKMIPDGFHMDSTLPMSVMPAGSIVRDHSFTMHPDF